MNKSKINNIDYFFIENKKYKTNTINIYFKEKVSKENVIRRQILPKILLDKTMNYDTPFKLSRKASSLYSCSLLVKENVFSDYSLLQFSITYIRSKYLDKDITKDIIELLNELIYNPYVINGKFDEDKLNRLKNELKNAIKRKESSFQLKAREQALELLYKDKSCVNRILKNENIDKVTNEQLYSYYKEVLNTNEMLIVFEGDEDIKQHLSMFKTNIENKYEYNVCAMQTNDLGLVINKDNTKQNNLCFIYENFSADDKDNVKSFLFCMMLGDGANSLLFQEVREKHSLAYSIGSQFDPFYKTMFIYGGVKLDSLDKTIEIINEQLNRLKTEDLNWLLKDAKQGYLNNLYSSLDLKGFLTTRTVRGWLSDEYTTIEDLISRINNVTLEDIKEIANKVQSKLMYVLQGEVNNENN